MSVTVRRLEPSPIPCGVRCEGCTGAAECELDLDATFFRACVPCMTKVAQAIGGWLVLSDKAAHKEMERFYGMDKLKRRLLTANAHARELKKIRA